MTKQISITKVCGAKIVTREDGMKLFELIATSWHRHEKITIDFGNVLIASVSFLDEIFGRMALKYSREEIVSKLVIRRIKQFDRGLLNNIMRSRFRQKTVRLKLPSKTPARGRSTRRTKVDA